MQKKLIFSLSIALLTQITVTAQSTDTAFAMIRYHYSFLFDTTQRGDPVTENTVLYLGKKASIYRTYEREISAIARKQQKVVMDAQGRSAIPVEQGGSNKSYYKDLESGKLEHMINAYGATYVMEEDLPVINWEIKDQTKDIYGLLCQKATAMVKGRFYEAWFCSQLPYSNGPWKLGGLPGLIIEASDSKKEVVFNFISMEDISALHVPIGMPKNVIKAAAGELKDFFDAVVKNQAAMSGASSTANPAPGVKITATITLAPGHKAITPNNSIEKGAGFLWWLRGL